MKSLMHVDEAEYLCQDLCKWKTVASPTPIEKWWKILMISVAHRFAMGSIPGATSFKNNFSQLFKSRLSRQCPGENSVSLVLKVQGNPYFDTRSFM